MIEQIGVALPFTAFYTTLGSGTTGLTVTVDVYRNSTEIVTGASATDEGDGFYTYTLASGSNTVEGVYKAVFKTATTTVDQPHIPAAWYVGSLPQDVWEYTTRTLTALGFVPSLAVAVAETDAVAVSSGSMSFTSYVTFTQSVTSTITDDLSAATKLWLSVKDNANDPDSKSLVFIEETAGLTYCAKSAYGTASDGSLVVSGSTGAWSVAVTLKAAASGLLHNYNGKGKAAQVKALIGGAVVEVWSGSAIISRGVVQAVA